MKKIILAIILINGSICYGQIPSDIPSYIEKIFYIDYSSETGGDGSFESPWKDISDIPSTYYSTNWPRLGWDYSKAAILFRRDVTMWGDNPRRGEFRVEADSVYIGSYGEGAMAKLLFDSNTRGVRVNGRGTVISHLHIHNLDTVTFSVALAVGGPQGTSRQGIALIDSVEISRGYRGLTFGNMQRADVVNTVIHTINHDAVYISASDSIIFNKLYSYGINRDWMWNRAGNVSGGDMIQTEGVAGNRIRYLEVDSSFFDYSMFGGKYAIISNQTDTTIVRNSVFIGHPITQSALRGANYLFENNEVYGFTHALWTVGGVSVVRNSLFAGFGEDFTFEGERPATSGGYAYLRGNFQDFYNNVVMYTYRVFEFPSENINSRNNIYYDVNDVFHTGVRSYHGSSDIHWRTDGNQNSFTEYDELYPEIISDPLFVDPVIERVHYIEIEGTGDGAWSWFEITRFPDLRLQNNSPGIGAADPRVWNTEATFTFGGNTTNNWGQSEGGDAVFERKFSEFYLSALDKNGRKRPGEGKYDIGAYEYGTTEVTISGLIIDNKEYDGTTDAAVSDWGVLEGVQSGNDVQLLADDHQATFSSKAAGTGKEVIVSGLALGGDYADRYFINDQATTADITTRELTLAGSFEVSDKIHDGTRDAVITDSQLELEGVIPGDDVVIDDIVAEFAVPAIGEDIDVYIVSASLSGDDAGNYTLSLEGAPTSTAEIFEFREYTLTVITEGEGSVKVDEEVYTGIITVQEGTELTLEAIADEGWAFDGWSGDLVSDNAVETVAMDSYKAINAVFTLVTGIEPVTAGRILLFPNPFNDHIVIENTRFAERIYITSLTGQKLIVVELTGSEREVLQTGSLASGAYLVIIESAGGERQTVIMIKGTAQ